jgi:hypothetical protein
MRRSTSFERLWGRRAANGPLFALAQLQLHQEISGKMLILGSTNGSCDVAMRYNG